MPTPRGELAAAAFHGRIHVVGGVTPAGPLDAHEAYDPRERRWLPLHPMPTARYGLGVAVAGGRLYAVAGGSAAAGVTTGVNEFLSPLLPSRGAATPGAAPEN
jgi:hypothetical protein